MVAKAESRVARARRPEFCKPWSPSEGALGVERGLRAAWLLRVQAAASNQVFCCCCFLLLFGALAGTCPVGTAWVGKARSVGGLGLDAHGQAECSNAGACDRQSGSCVCAPGRTGAACERVGCPQSVLSGAPCSGLGKCLPLSDLGRLFGIDGDPSVRGDGAGPTYAVSPSGVWDAETLNACLCDGGFGAADCSVALCPKGPNPYTTGKQRRAFRFSIDLNGATPVPDTFQTATLRFLGSETHGLDLGLLGALTDAECAAWAATHPFVGEAACAVSVSNVDEYQLDLRLGWETSRKPHNNFFDHDGNPPLAWFSCNARHVSDSAVACSVADLDVTSAMVYAANGDTGFSIVFEVVDDTSNPNTYKVTVATTTYGPFPMSTAPAAIGTMPSATVAWTVLWGHKAGAQWHVSSTNEVTPPGLEEHRACGGVGRCDVFSGVCTCPYGAEGPSCGKLFTTDETINDALPVSVLTADSLQYAGDILQMRAKRSRSSDFNFISVSEAANAPLMVLSGDGHLRSRSIQGDMGATVLSGGLFVGGGGGTILSGGLNVVEGHVSAAHTTFNEDVLSAHSHEATFQNALLKLSADRAASDAFRIIDVVVDRSGAATRLMQLLGNGQLEVVSGPLVASSAEGAWVTGTGGLHVTAGGATLQAGTTIESTDATASALSVGMAHPTFTGTGINVVATQAAQATFKFAEVTASGTAQAVLTHHGDGRLQVHRGGIETTGGLTVTTGGIAVAAGLSEFDSGIDVTGGGMTVSSGGLAVSTGGTVLANADLANAHVLRSSATALTAGHRVVSVESDTKATTSADHALLWAGSQDGAGVMTERLKLTAAGVLSVTGHIHLSAKRPSVVATSDVSLTGAQCGAVVAAGSAAAGAAPIVVTLPQQLGTEAAGCFVTVVVAETAREVQIRNGQTIGALYGKWPYFEGGTYKQGSIQTTGFLTSGGGTGIALGIPTGADSFLATVTLSAITGLPLGSNVWYVTEGHGPWASTAF